MCLILAADNSTRLLPTVISRCTRVRLGPVAADELTRILAERGVGDAARGAALARLTGGRPGAALALAANSEAVVAQGRLARSLLDLLSADRRRRLASAQELIDDGATLAAAAGATLPLDGDAEVPQKQTKGRARVGGAARRASPAERRAAVTQIVAVWRDVARDLAVAARGGTRELHQHDLLDELSDAGKMVDATEVTGFLQRIDAIGRALDGYANPELALDVLLIEWPRTRIAA